MKLLALTKYSQLGASSRIRSFQYFFFLNNQNIKVSLQSFLANSQLESRYKSGFYGVKGLFISFFNRIKVMRHRHNFDLLWIEKETLPWCPLWFELLLLRGVPYVLDYDDAIFHSYDQHPFALVRFLYGKRLDKLMSKATLVVAGNEYLAKRALAAGAKWVEVLPTVIDLARYPSNTAPILKTDVVLRIVWIGSPSTARYLHLLQKPLQLLSVKHNFVLRVIGADIQLPGITVECFPWSEATEVSLITACDVGVMPLLDSPWERGKCGYKLIQYMACGLPVVASPVGVNVNIVKEDLNGFLAYNTDAWVSALEKLLTNCELRLRMGKTGRKFVEDRYCLQVTAPRLVDLLREAAKKT